jgi:hypothetical protein
VTEAATVCVALSVKNGGAYLADSIESVLAQEEVALELRIYDNGSTDGSVESVRVRQLFPDFQPEPRPGSVVYVTERDAQDKTDPVARLAVIAQIIGSLVAIVAITKR